MIPNRIELNPGESKEILIQGYGEKPQLIEEVITCQAIIGKLSGKDRIMKFKVKCEFISPLISFSTKDIIFRCEHVIFIFLYALIHKTGLILLLLFLKNQNPSRKTKLIFSN